MKKINLNTFGAIEYRGLGFGNIMKSVFMSYIMSIALLGLFAIILAYTNFPESAISTVVLAVSIVSILYAGKVSTKKATSRGWLIGAIAGTTYMLVLYLVSLIFNPSPVFDAHVLSVFIIGLTSGAVGGIIGINMKKSDKR